MSDDTPRITSKTPTPQAGPVAFSTGKGNIIRHSTQDGTDRAKGFSAHGTPERSFGCGEMGACCPWSRRFCPTTISGQRTQRLGDVRGRRVICLISR